METMNRRTTTRVAWALWAFFIAATALLLVLLTVNGFASSTPLPTELLLAVAMTAFATVGAVIASRRPDNAIGWLFLAIGVVTNFSNLAAHYARYALVTASDPLPGGAVAAWFSHWALGLGIEMIVFLLLLFPTGHPPSPRWRPVLWLITFALAAFALDSAFRPGPLTELGFALDNPFGISGWRSLFEALDAVANVLLLAVAVAAAASLVQRARRSTGVERQQLKWFGYAAAFLVVSGFGINVIIETLFSNTALRDLPFVFGMTLVPVATGIAVLRYRLYDIDLIISRTLVYGSLTAVIAAVYGAGVFGLGEVLRAITGAASNDLAVAGSTLAVAALFRPARARIQAFVDRRFYRSRYDAARTLDTFSARLRDSVDLDALSAELLAVVRGTVHPVHASLWLRDEPERVSRAEW
jgi:hypothetical protein